MSWFADNITTPIVTGVRAEIHDQLDKWFPILLLGVGKTILETSLKMAEHGVDKLTDMTPGELDDKILDPIAHTVTTWLGGLFSGELPK